MNNKQSDKELAKEMINQYDFIDENLKTDFKTKLENHNIIHANFILTITPFSLDFRIETLYFDEILEDIYARLLNY